MSLGISLPRGAPLRSASASHGFGLKPVASRFLSSVVSALNLGTAGLSACAGKIAWMQRGRTVSEASYKVDSTKNPKQIESTMILGPQKGKVSTVTYRLEGDTLRLSQTQDRKQAAKGFQGRGARQVVLVLKRQKG